jgi:hypothetical protein
LIWQLLLATFCRLVYYTTRPVQMTAKTRGGVAAESDTQQLSNKIMTIIFIVAPCILKIH